MPTVRLNNGNIEADGSLNALSITTREMQTDNLNVTGQLTASGDVAANRILGNVNVTGAFNTAEVHADTISVSAIHGLTNVYGDVQAMSIQATAINGLTTVTGGLSLGGNLTADSVVVEGIISGVKSLQADTADIGGDLRVSGSMQASTLSITGTLDVDSVNCDTLNGAVNVQGDINAEALTITSGISVLSIDCNKIQVKDILDSSGINALTVNVNDTLNVSGDLIVEGEDDRVLGESFQSLTGATMQMKHNVWYHSGTISYINVLADVDAGRVKTCYLIACPSSPLVLNGVNWLWTPVDLEDSSKTHVIALQQIGAGPVMANLAYSYPV